MLVDGANIPGQCKDRGVLIIEKIKRVGGVVDPGYSEEWDR